MAIKQILGSDKISSGFRQKYNETVGEIIVSATDNGDGTVSFFKHNGGHFKLNLKLSFLVKSTTYTQTQVNNILTAAAERGIFIWTAEDAAAGVYDTDFFVYRNGNIFKSNIDNNVTIPGDNLQGSEWKLIKGESLTLASNAAKKTVLSITPAQLADSGGDIVVDGITLSCLDGVVAIPWTDDLFDKHDIYPHVQAIADHQWQPVSPTFDDQEQPSVLSINIGFIPSTNLIITLI